MAIPSAPSITVNPPAAGRDQSAVEALAQTSSYAQILRSTLFVGGSQVINVAVGIVRTKVMAMLLGPSGFGVAGLYMSLAQLTQNIAGLGINQSGVRQIAEASGTGDLDQLARTASVLHQTSWLLGLLGGAVLFLFARPIAAMTFGNTDHTYGVATLAAVVCLNLVSAGNAALLQGARRIRDLAATSVLGAILGTLCTIPAVYFFRERGIVPSLVLTAAVTVFASYRYTGRLSISRSGREMKGSWDETSRLLGLGFMFMVSALLTLGSSYLIRVIVAHTLGVRASGFYHAAWTLGGLYVGMVVQAMGADFYPRLAACAHSDVESNRLVCEQLRVSMIVAGPGILITLFFAPVIISLLYTPDFQGAVGVLRWICLGISMRLLSWPLGYVIIAKGDKTLFFVSDLLWATTHLGLAWFFVPRFGLEGSGMAFFGAYVCSVLFNYLAARKLSRFKWTCVSGWTTILYIAAAVLAFVVCVSLSHTVVMAIGLLISTISTAYSIRVLCKITGHRALRLWARVAG